jgi:hypothetical protein
VTVLCGVGGSEPKPGSANDILLTSAILEAILSEAGLGILSPFVGYLGSVIQLSLPTFCALDPPADPGLSGADILSLVALGPGPLTAGAAARFTQLIQRYAWFDYCQCSAITTPAPPSPPTITDLPAINPAGPPIPTIPPCFSADFGTADLGFADTFFDFTFGASRATQWVATVETECIGIGDCSDTWLTAQPRTQVGAVETQTTDPPYVVPTGDNQIFSHLLGPNSSGVNFFVTTAEGTGDLNSVRVHIDVYCNGIQPGQTNTPCCPPDPIATAKLDSILQLVTLMQRQVAPFSYVIGAAHSALTGDGSVSVQGILGVHASLSVPDYLSVIDGTPAVHLRPGRINFGTADGFEDRHELVIGEQLVFPNVAGLWTAIGYTLADGVTLTLEELMRES